MTKDQILSMQGGELNEAVAEHVMKFVAWQEKRGNYIYVVFQRQGEREPWHGYRDKEMHKQRYSQIAFSQIDSMKHVVMDVPNYSGDISAAIEAAEKLGTWQLTKMHVGNQSRQYKAVVKANKHIAYAETAPLAISRAALLAVMGL